MHTMPLLDWSRLQSRLTWAYEGPVTAAFRHFTHTSQQVAPGRVALWHLLEGGVTVQCRDRTQLEAEAGDLVLLARPHRQDFTDDARIRSVAFNLYWGGQIPLFPSERSERIRAADARRLASVTRHLTRTTEQLAPGSDTLLALHPLSANEYLRIKTLYDRWAILFLQEAIQAGWELQPEQAADPRLVRAMAHLDAEPGASVSDLARAAGLSVSQLERLFLRRYGQAPRRIQDRRRWQAVEQRIRVSEDPIKEIAFDMGFRQLSHFSAWFKRHAGCAPREYRRIGRTAGPGTAP